MFAFFSLGLQELIVLGCCGFFVLAVGVGIVVLVVSLNKSEKRDPEE